MVVPANSTFNDTVVNGQEECHRESSKDDALRVSKEVIQTPLTQETNTVLDLDAQSTIMAYVKSYHLPQRPIGYSQNDRIQSKSIWYGPKERKILGPSRSMLNDECINGLAAVFKSSFSQNLETTPFSAQCALFSTFDMSLVRDQADDEKLWRHTKRTIFWEKKVWIVPIHKPLQRHWILAILYLEDGRYEIRLYDSLAMCQWNKDMEDIWRFIVRLSKLSNQYGHTVPDPTGEAWIIERPFRTALQSNAYDCGLWVLAWIADILRGRDPALSDTTEDMMGKWRLVLGDLAQRHG